MSAGKTVQFVILLIVCVGLRRQSFAAPPPRVARYLEPTIGQKNVDVGALSTRLARAGVQIPVALKGKVSYSLKAGIPWNDLGNSDAYRLDGAIQSDQLEIGGLVFSKLDARLRYRARVLSLDALRFQLGVADAKISPGLFTGKANMDLKPGGQFTASVDFRDLPWARLLFLVTDRQWPIEGRVSGVATANVPTANLSSAASLSARVTVKDADLRYEDWTLQKGKGLIELDGGVARVRRLEFALKDITGRLMGVGDWSPVNQSFEATIDLLDVSLADVIKLTKAQVPFPISGALTAKAAMKGTLPLTPPYAITGGVGVQDLAVGPVAIPTARGDFATDLETLDLRRLSARVFDGELTGEANIPLKADKEWRIKLNGKEWDLAKIDDVMPTGSLGLSGRVDVSLEGSLRESNDSKTPNIEGTSRITGTRLRALGAPIDRLDGVLTAKKHSIDYQLSAELLNGRFQLEGKSPLLRDARPNESLSGKATFDRLELRRLSEAWFSRRLDLGGRVDGAISFHHAAGRQFPDGNGRVEFRDVRAGGVTLARQWTTDLVMRDGELSARNFTGEAFGGLLRGFVSYNPRNAAHAQFQLTIDRASLPAMLTLAPGAPKLPGVAQLDMRGRIGREIVAAGTIQIPRTQWDGVHLEAATAPFRLHVWPGSSRARLRLRQASVHVSEGRASGDVELDWNGAWSINGQARYSDIHLDAILRELMGSTQIASGRIEGDVSIRGERLTSLSEAQVQLRGKIHRTSAQQMPIIGRLLPYFQGVTAGIGSPVFDQGGFEARYRGGALTIERLDLDGQALRVHIHGMVYTGGRLRLDVIASSGPRALAERAIRAIATKFLVATVPPLAILEANQLLSNRVVYLTVEGTIHSPVIRVRPVPTLTAEAIRFFLIGL